jgi:hypothetical protein
LKRVGEKASNIDRTWVETVQTCTACDVDERLSSGTGYDIALARPLSSCHPVRLEARIEGPVDGKTLLSPLQQQPCVKFSAAVYRQERDGMRSHPVALHSGSLHFVASLIDAPHRRIEIIGDEVALFDMVDGYCSEKQTFASAPDHWRRFILAQLVDITGGSERAAPGDEEMFEFRESALLVGSHVTLLGELRRDGIGRLHLHAWRARRQRLGEPEETPCEQSRCDDASSASSGKVLASDDPTLLRSSHQLFLQECTKYVHSVGQTVGLGVGTTFTSFTPAENDQEAQPRQQQPCGSDQLAPLVPSPGTRAA